MIRRDFLGTFAALALSGPEWRMRLAEQMRRTPRLSVFLYDDRDGGARDVGRQLRERGVQVIAVRGNSTPLWAGGLDAVVRDGRVVAGLTGYPDFLIARLCGRDTGAKLRTVDARSCHSGGLTGWTLTPARDTVPGQASAVRSSVPDARPSLAAC